MLNTNSIGAPARHHHAAAQRGVVLVMALIVLAAMTLAGIGLMRSVFTGNKVAGNLAFQQSATHEADRGVEAAVTWLERINATNPLMLHLSRLPVGIDLGYFASWQQSTDPNAAGGSWEQSWTAWEATGRVNDMGRDGTTGNRVRYVIHRLCNAEGPPESGIFCNVSPSRVGDEGSSRGAGVPPINVPSQRYYRITVRVDGPRNTVSFVQSIVAL